MMMSQVWYETRKILVLLKYYCMHLFFKITEKDDFSLVAL